MFKKFILISFLLVSIAAVITNQFDRSFTYGVMNRVETIEEANAYARKFQIELTSLSPYGVATYATQRWTHYQSLIQTGLFHNDDISISSSFDGGELTNDPLLFQQYGLSFTGIAESWNTTTGDPSIVVAIIDTGVDLNHPDLVHALSSTGYNASTLEEGLVYADDLNGHGTKVAGVIVGAHNNGQGIAGAAPNVTIMPIRASIGTTSSFSSSAVINAVWFAIEQEVQIINLSLAFSSTNTLLEEAVLAAHDQGIIVVAASGNNGKEQKAYPAAYPSVLAIGSVSDQLNRSFFSNYHDQIDFLAPGHNIYTTVRGGYYDVSSGTSFASPYAAAMIALLWSYEPLLSVTEVYERLEATVIDVGPVGFDIEHGHGILNIYRALNHTSTMPEYSYDVAFDASTINLTNEIYSNHEFSNVSWDISLGGSQQGVIAQGNQFGSNDHPLESVNVRSEYYEPSLFNRVGILDIQVTLQGLNSDSEGHLNIFVGPHPLTSIDNNLIHDQLATYRFTSKIPRFGNISVEFEGLTNGFVIHHLGVYSIGTTSMRKAFDFSQSLQGIDSCDAGEMVIDLSYTYSQLNSISKTYLARMWIDDYEFSFQENKSQNLVNAEQKWFYIQARYS